ncbi:hypothetical protein HY605_02805 [Candidatus Peregrinibacteria bacterium]|nr:hypothetical protein [Candidatus Peregrinibacteria bacterium]
MVQAAPGGPPEGARTEGVAPIPIPAKVPLFSPLGYIIVLVILVVEGVLVYMMAGFFHSGGSNVGPGGKGGPESAPTFQLDLDEIEVSFDVPNPANPEITEPHYLTIRKPVISFEKSKEGADMAIKEATNKKAKLIDIIRVMLEQKGYRSLKQANVLEEMKLDIRDRINQELKIQVINDVYYGPVVWR